MLKRFAKLLTARRMNVLFVESHGLRSHLAALRWAASRLRKSASSLSGDQRRLVGEIHDHTRILTAALNSMLILGRVEEGEYEPRLETFALLPALEAMLGDGKQTNSSWRVVCDERIHVVADRTVLSTLLTDTFFLCREGASKDQQVVLSAREVGRWVEMHFYAAWEFPFLERTGQDAQKSIGGTPGLMLSLAAGLARLLGGNAELEEIATEEDDLVVDGTVERDAAGSRREYRIVLRLPVAMN